MKTKYTRPARRWEKNNSLSVSDGLVRSFRVGRKETCSGKGEVSGVCSVCLMNCVEQRVSPEPQGQECIGFGPPNAYGHQRINRMISKYFK